MPSPERVALRRRPPMVEQALRVSMPVNSAKDFQPMIERIRDARVIMFGEASHGTHEFYEIRRILSEWLIQKHGFSFIAVEGDWPPCQRLDRYIKTGEPGNARTVLGAFDRWPTWMWANTEMIRLAEWLRTHNSRISSARNIGFHGLDVYSLFESIDAVISELERLDPVQAAHARERYACFDPFGRDERAYARSLIDFPEGCENQVVEELQELLQMRMSNWEESGDALFDAQQNARIIRNAERYYRAMVRGDDESWNVRDEHMMASLEILLDRYGPDSKAIVWAHNTHIGDYRATDMVRAGLINLGGLARERFGDDSVALVGFGTYQGSVIASHSWDGPIQTLTVPPARDGSYDEQLHQVSAELGAGTFQMIFDSIPAEELSLLKEPRGQRAVGVVYDPAHERLGNYVPTSLTNRYDAFVFVDETHALEPLIQSADFRNVPETWPRGQ